MKRLIVFVLIFSIHSLFAQAEQTGDPATKECADCSTKKVPQAPANQKELSEVEDLKDKIDDERIKDLVIRICRSALTFRNASADTAGESIEYMLLKFLGTSKEDKNHKQILTKFWNENSEKLICTDEGSTKYTRNPQHFMKRIVDLGMYKSVLYDFLLSDEDDYPINVNAIEVYKGKKETVLDYIDNILKDPAVDEKYNVKEIQSLRRALLNDYGAKKASEL